MSNAATYVEGLIKRYGRKEALTGVDLTVPEGSFFALLGANGAGKTTLLRCLAGLIRPDGGRGAVLGAPLGPGYPSQAVKQRIGYAGHQSALYDDMTVGELIRFCQGLHPRWEPQVVRRYQDLFGLAAGLKVKQMSTGMRSQLSLTLVMGGNPDLLILDEPTLGLDPLHRHQYLQVLLKDSLEAGRTVILSSHDLHPIERLADRVAILQEGRIVLTGQIDDLKEREKRVRVAGEVGEATLGALPGVRKAVRERNGWLLAASGDADELRATLAALPGVAGVQVLDQSLEEIFISYVS